jgi:acyl phosphate:glycerol-3-phosphate acyltransferase
MSCGRVCHVGDTAQPFNSARSNGGERLHFGLSTFKFRLIHYRVPISGYIVTVVLAYLLGSMPTGFLVGKARGVDIRTMGSGNIGATNVFRYLGTVAGIAVLAVDALKGFLAVAVLTRVVWHMFGRHGDLAAREATEIVAGLAAVLGHNFTCWLRFKGGKGIATSAGVLVALVPYSLLIILAVWIIVFGLTRFVSLASICASFTLPFAAWATGSTPTLIAITAGMAVLAIYKHRTNMQRLLKGTESRLCRKAAATASRTKTSP